MKYFVSFQVVFKTGFLSPMGFHFFETTVIEVAEKIVSQDQLDAVLKTITEQQEKAEKREIEYIGICSIHPI